MIPYPLVGNLFMSDCLRCRHHSLHARREEVDRPPSCRHFCNGRVVQRNSNNPRSFLIQSDLTHHTARNRRWLRDRLRISHDQERDRRHIVAISRRLYAMLWRLASSYPPALCTHLSLCRRDASSFWRCWLSRALILLLSVSMGRLLPCRPIFPAE